MIYASCEFLSNLVSLTSETTQFLQISQNQQIKPCFWKIKNPTFSGIFYWFTSKTLIKTIPIAELVASIFRVSGYKTIPYLQIVYP